MDNFLLRDEHSFVKEIGLCEDASTVQPKNVQMKKLQLCIDANISNGYVDDKAESSIK
jgi:hypothetical protein